MIIYYAGSGTSGTRPESVLKKPAVLLTYFHYWKNNDKLDKRFAKHKQRREKKRANRLT